MIRLGMGLGLTNLSNVNSTTGNQSFLDVKENGHVVDVINIGAILRQIVFINKTANEVIIDVGTALGLSDIAIDAVVPASGSVIYTINAIPSLVAKTSLFFSSADWNGAKVDIHVLVESPISSLAYTYEPET